MTKRQHDITYVPQKCPKCGRDTLDKYHFVNSLEQLLCIYQSLAGEEIPQAERDHIAKTQLEPNGWRTVESVALRQ